MRSLDYELDFTYYLNDGKNNKDFIIIDVVTIDKDVIFKCLIGEKALSKPKIPLDLKKDYFNKYAYNYHESNREQLYSHDWNLFKSPNQTTYICSVCKINIFNFQKTQISCNEVCIKDIIQ